MDFNQKTIKQLREKLGLTQKQLSDKLGTSRVTIMRWETGRSSPGRKMREKLNQIVQDVSSAKNDTSRNDTSAKNDTSENDTSRNDTSAKNDTSRNDTSAKNDTSRNDTSENVSSAETDKNVTPEEYFSAAYKDASGYLTLCAITQPKSSDKRGRLLVKGTYSTDSIPELLSDVNELNGQYHIYTNIHPLREPPQQGRGKESDILGVCLFATDTDAKDFISDQKEREKAIRKKAFYEWTDELLKECKAKTLEHITSVTSKVGVPPSVIIDSGHGYYPIFFLEKFIVFESDRHREEIKAVNKILHEALSADATFDFARILRVTGTKNIKPGYPAECKLIEFHPERRYTVSDIRRFEKVIFYSSSTSGDKDKEAKDFSSSNKDKDKESTSKGGSSPSKDGKIDLTQFSLSEETIHIIETGDASDYKSRSERDHSVVFRLVGAYATDKEIKTIFRQYPVGDKYHQKGNGDRYLSLSIEKARKWYRNNRKVRFKGSSWVTEDNEPSEDEKDKTEPQKRKIPKLPEEVWRLGFADYREALKNATEAPDEFHFAMYLASAGAIIGRQSYVRLGRILFPNFYLCLVGPTGSSKKTTAAHFGTELLWQVDQRVLILSGLSTPEGLLQAMKDEHRKSDMDYPLAYRTLALHDELATLMKKAQQKYASGLVGKLTELFDCPRFAENRTKNDPIRIDYPFLSLIGLSTASWLEDSITEKHIMGGFANRFMYFVGKPKDKIAMPPPPDREAWQKASATLLDLVDFVSDREEQIEVKLSDQALALWKHWYEDVWGKMVFDSEIVHALVQRVPSNIISVAHTYSQLERCTLVNWKMLSAAIKVGEYDIDCIRYIFRLFGANEYAIIEAKIIDILKELGGETSRRKLHQKLSGRISAYSLRNHLEALATMDKVSLWTDEYTDSLNRKRSKSMITLLKCD